jgi:uncharacterized SAM-binding protein YcdF (DUF218 family)
MWQAVQRVVLASAGIFSLWFAGFIWFAIPPPVESRPAPTDAIVVLTGGSLRLRSGLELLREGKGGKLFVSGVNPQVDLDDVLRVSRTRDWALCCIVLGHDAENTLGNAHETAQWIRQQGFRSLRLVTSWYHMPRSLLEFDRAMPGIEIVPHPVFPEQVEQGRWWTQRGTAALLVGEYLKYLAALSRPAVEWLQSPQAGRPERPQAELRQ